MLAAAMVSPSAESPETQDTLLASAASASGEDSSLSDANLGLAATVADAETQTEEFEYRIYPCISRTHR